MFDSSVSHSPRSSTCASVASTDRRHQQPLGSDSPLRDLVAIYKRDYLPLKARTTAAQCTNLLTWMMESLGDVPLEALTPARLRLWKEDLVNRYQPGTVRRYMDVLSAVLTAATKDLDLFAENPMRKVRKPKQPKGRTRFLSENERDRLIAACKANTRQPALYPVVMLALCTGARKMEILTLQWQHIDLERGVVRYLDTKNGESRGTPLATIAREALQGWMIHRRQGIPLVFPRPDGREPVHLDTAFRQALRDADIQNFHFHDLRHTAASYLAMSGASLRDIAEVLGHKNIAMSRKYSHLTMSHTAGIVERMASTLLKPKGGSRE